MTEQNLQFPLRRRLTYQPARGDAPNGPALRPAAPPIAGGPPNYKKTVSAAAGGALPPAACRLRIPIATTDYADGSNRASRNLRKTARSFSLFIQRGRQAATKQLNGKTEQLEDEPRISPIFAKNNCKRTNTKP